MPFFDKHRDTLAAAVEACRTRASWSAYDAATTAGTSELRPPDLDQPGKPRRQADEVSPYTGEPLGMEYPAADVDALVDAATTAWPAWRDASATERIGVCLEMGDRLFARNDELAAAAMHTTGQSHGMSLTGSGTNALDRGLEAIAQAHLALGRVPSTARWTRAFGTTQVDLDKRYRTVPLGIAAVVACASFPAWNVYPALFANLATGNPVIVKPHPTSVLQMALAVRICRDVLEEAGFDPNLVTLAVDTVAEPVTKQLVTHRRVRIVDFTGSSAFGGWIERHATQARVYTETSGTNAVLMESVTELPAVLRALAGSLCLFSAQMCTSPQNIYVPRAGIGTPDGRVSLADFTAGLADAIRAVATVPRRAAAVLGAIQSPRTIDDLVRMAERTGGRTVLAPDAYDHPQFPGARTSGPLLAAIDIADHELYREERFGPIAFVIASDDADQALARAATDAAEGGAITAFVYSTDESYLDRAENAYALAGAAVTANLTGAMPLNFSAAYSDFHVTGLNPAGTATLSDEAFVAGRFRIAQSRRPHTEDQP